MLKLGKLGFDLDSSSNINAVQNAVKKLTEIISECGDKTLWIEKRSKVKKKLKRYTENCALFRKQFTEIAMLL